TVGLRASMDHPLPPHGNCCLAGLARSGICASRRGARIVPGATGRQCPLDLAVLRLADGLDGLSGDPRAVGPYRCDDRGILANPSIRWPVDAPLSRLGHLRRHADLFDMAKKSGRSGIMKPEFPR